MFGEHAGDIAEAAESAAVIVPLVVDLLQPRSVVDVGCGTGAFVREFLDAGVPSVHGIDNGPSEELLFDPALYSRVDLTSGRVEGFQRYDLAVCLEVGEHLPSAASAELVASLTALAGAVLFSAAIPGQGGPGHVNERWQAWWADLFIGHGYVPSDTLRPATWADERVAYWYRQNMLLYTAGGEGATVLDVVHPALLIEKQAKIARLAKPPGLAGLPKVVLASVRASVARRRG